MYSSARVSVFLTTAGVLSSLHPTCLLLTAAVLSWHLLHPGTTQKTNRKTAPHMRDINIGFNTVNHHFHAWERFSFHRINIIGIQLNFFYPFFSFLTWTLKFHSSCVVKLEDITLVLTRNPFIHSGSFQLLSFLSVQQITVNSHEESFIGLPSSSCFPGEVLILGMGTALSDLRLQPADSRVSKT